MRLAAHHEFSRHIDCDGDHQHDRHQCEWTATGLHVLQAVKNLHACHVAIFKHQRRSQFRETPNEHNHRARERTRRDQRHCDAAKARPRARAKIARGLFKRGIKVG